MFKKIFGFLYRKNKSQVTYSDIKKKFKRYSKSQLIKMLTADQIIIDNMAKEYGVRDVKRYLKK